MRLDTVRMYLCLWIAAWAPFTSTSATAGDEDDYVRRLAALVNQYRQSKGRPALAVDGTIAKLASEHSLAMSKSGQLNHDGFQSRVTRSGFPMCVENVGWNYPSAKGQFDAWRASPGHDRNMLDARVNRVGIGFAARYVTMIACGR